MSNVKQHGYSGWTQQCKCDVCRAAKAAYDQAYRARGGVPAPKPARVICPTGKPSLKRSTDTWAGRP